MTDTVPPPSPFGQQGNPSEVLIKLIDLRHIETVTNLTPKQLKAYFRLTWLEIINNPENKGKNRLTLLKQCYKDFMKYLPSNRGERVKQITDTLKEMKHYVDESPLLGNLK